MFLSYPFHLAGGEDVARRVAAERGVPFVPIRERFDAELRTRARTDLFVADGHCSDAGGSILAAMTADVIAPLLW